MNKGLKWAKGRIKDADFKEAKNEIWQGWFPDGKFKGVFMLYFNKKNEAIPLCLISGLDKRHCVDVAHKIMIDHNNIVEKI